MKSVPFCHIREHERISRRDDINVISRSVIGCSPVSLTVYVRFFEKGDQGPVIIRFQFRGMERFPRARGRHARYDSRRCPVSRIHGIHCVTKLPLHEQEIRCARRAKKLGCIPFAIVPLAPLDQPFFPRSVSAQSLFITSSHCCPPTTDIRFVKEG